MDADVRLYVEFRAEEHLSSKTLRELLIRGSATWLEGVEIQGRAPQEQSAATEKAV